MDVFVPKVNLGIPRSKMPQIKSAYVREFMTWLESRGVGSVRGSMRASVLKATQKELNKSKVEGLADVSNLTHLKKPVIISDDLYLMDGHHRWMALVTLDPNAKIGVIRVDLKIRELLDMAQHFSKVSHKDLAAGDEWAARELVSAVRLMSGDETENPTVVEYGVQEMMKRKTPRAAARMTARKLGGGGNNVFLGEDVQIDEKRLENALWGRMVDYAVKGALSMKAGFEHFALDGTVDHFKQKPSLRAELKKRVIKKVGKNIFMSDDREASSRVAESVDFSSYAKALAGRIESKISDILPVKVNYRQGNTWGSIEVTYRDWQKSSRGLANKLKTFFNRERGVEVESMENINDMGFVVYLNFKHEEPNPLNGLTRSQASKFVNELIYPYTKGFFRDQNWKPIHDIRKVLDRAQLDWNMTDNKYTHDRDTGNPDGKNWEFEVRFWNKRGVKNTLYGYIRASGAGPVNDVLQKYDVVAYVN